MLPLGYWEGFESKMNHKVRIPKNSIIQPSEGRKCIYLNQANIFHMCWATGGSLVPDSIRKELIS